MDQVQYDSLAPFDILDIAKVNSKPLLAVLLENFNLYGFDINATDADGNSLLHILVYHDNSHLISKAIQLGANINQLNNKRQTPLHVAADQNKPECAWLLLKYRAIQNILDEECETPVFKATRKGHLKVVKVFIETRGDFKSENIYGDTLLHVAAFFGHVELIELLIKSCLKKETKNSVELTPLQVATENCHRQIVTLLIKNGANSSVLDSKKRTLLHIAVQKGDPRLVKTLVDYKLNINAKDITGATPLHYAIAFRMGNIALLLLRCRARFDIEDNDGYTALHLASKSRSLAMTVLSVLVSKGADVYQKTFNGDTSIHIAAFAGNLDGIKQLVKQKDDVYLKNCNGQTPIYLAQRCGHLDVFEYLNKYRSLARKAIARSTTNLGRSKSMSRDTRPEVSVRDKLKSGSMLSLIPRKTRDGMRRAESMQVLSTGSQIKR